MTRTDDEIRAEVERQTEMLAQSTRDLVALDAEVKRLRADAEVSANVLSECTELLNSTGFERDAALDKLDKVRALVADARANHQAHDITPWVDAADLAAVLAAAVPTGVGSSVGTSKPGPSDLEVPTEPTEETK